MRKLFTEYTIDYISGVMSLRKPQKMSLQILDSILDDIELDKSIDLEKAKISISDRYPKFKSFDRNFMSLTFALATGVGKTRLMGTFITYLYTSYGIKNFFVVAPSLTIYNKLCTDLGDSSSPKYVFKGVGCFSFPPYIIKGEDYRDKQFDGLSDVRIFIFNAQKFNSRDEKRKVNTPDEVLGKSFMDYLSSLDDLVIIMDEAHHYRNNSTSEALDKIHPLLGLELTATPSVVVGSKDVRFNNVVLDYPLAKSIRDGYTRTPYAMTRRDIEKKNWTPEEMDKMMLDDGIEWHEKMKTEIKAYAANNGVEPIKPFMLVVCSNIEHANSILSYIKASSFRDGYYSDKVIEVDSGKKGIEKDENVELLLNVERSDNKIEIVVHVNMLKEGWDVNNLYTIVPLRTAQSRNLIEQTIGRGLRLPYGKRTGNKFVDSVTLTAHDNFQKVIDDASRADSIFKKENIIDIDDVKPAHIEKVSLNLDFGDEDHKGFYESHPEVQPTDNNKDAFDKIERLVSEKISSSSNSDNKQIEDADKDLAKIIEDSDLDVQLLKSFYMYETDRQVKAIENVGIAFPIIDLQNTEQEYFFEDFDLDTSKMFYAPVSQEIIHRDLLDSNNTDTFETQRVYYLNDKPEKIIISILREKAEINYEVCYELLAKLIVQFFNYLKSKSFNDEEIKNIVFANRNDICKNIYTQMLKHLKCKSKGPVEIVTGITKEIVKPTFSFNDDGSNVKQLDYVIGPGESIKSLIFKGGQKSILEFNKFDSNSEKDFALCCENNKPVLKWLRPSPDQFNLRYNHGQKYEPDFVVETDEVCYLVEIKKADDVDDTDVVEKRKRAIEYCKLASEWCEANGYKKWVHLFIPHDKISQSSSFETIVRLFTVE